MGEAYRSNTREERRFRKDDYNGGTRRPGYQSGFSSKPRRRWGDDRGHDDDYNSNSRYRPRGTSPRNEEDYSDIEVTKFFLIENEKYRAYGGEEVRSYMKENGIRVSAKGGGHTEEGEKTEDIIKPFFTFDMTSFPQEILQEMTEKSNYEAPMPIQAVTWPIVLSGKNLVGIAQTGSGKTLSFVIPALIHASNQTPLRQRDGPIVLCLAPTRELCIQIYEVFKPYARLFDMNCVPLYGGVKDSRQIQQLRMGAHVVIATPGRLIDLYTRGFTSLGRVSFLILDEADRMLDMGFEPQLKEIIPLTNQNRQTVMWSATWPEEVQSLADSYIKEHIQVRIGSTRLVANPRIKQEIVIMPRNGYEGKDRKLEEIIQDVKSEVMVTPVQKRVRMIIFCNTKLGCDDILNAPFMRKHNISINAIHSDKNQAERTRILSRFRTGEVPVLVATDVAARGLDIPDVKYVVNYDFPPKTEDYIHRIGRTARGDAMTGIAYTFFTPGDSSNSRKLVQILEEAKQDIPEELEEMAKSSGGGKFKNRQRQMYTFSRRFENRRFSPQYRDSRSKDTYNN